MRPASEKLLRTAILLTFCIADIIGLHAQATEVAVAIAPPTPGATTSTVLASTPEKKTMKRKLPEPRDEWKDSAG